MISIKKLLFLVSIFSCKLVAIAQSTDKIESHRIVNLQFLYNYQMPGGDWANRFDDNHAVGVGVLFKPQNNWIVSAECNFLYGNNTKENGILYNLTNSSGIINDNGGNPADIIAGLRGWSACAKIGKLIAINPANKNHGILIQLGCGFLQHKINYNITNNNVAMLNENYIKGYDRLSNGWSVNEFVGYFFQSENRFINFYFGIDFTQAFTYNKREFNYDQLKFDKEQHQDNIIAFRFGWMIPLYLNNKGKDEFQFK